MIAVAEGNFGMRGDLEEREESYEIICRLKKWSIGLRRSSRREGTGRIRFGGSACDGTFVGPESLTLGGQHAAGGLQAHKQYVV